MPKVELRILGTPVLLRDGVPIEVLSWRVLELLAFLVISGGWIDRSALIEALYADGPADRRRPNLRQTLHYVKAAERLVGGSLVITTGQLVSIAEGLAVDVSHFELDQDLAAYRGPLLDGLFSGWIGPKRAELERSYVNLLVSRGSLMIANEPQQALALAEVAISLDPYLEQARRLKIRALVTMGELGQAQRESREFRDHVWQEIGVAAASDFEGHDGPNPTPDQFGYLSPTERLYLEIAWAPAYEDSGKLHLGIQRLLDGIRGISGPHPVIAAAKLTIARLYFEAGETQAAADHVMLARAYDLSNDQKALAALTLGRVRAREGVLDEAESLAKDALNLARSSRNPERSAEARLLLQFVEASHDRTDEAIIQCDKALALAAELDSQKITARALRMKASALFRNGEVEGAMQCLRVAIEAAGSAGRRDLEASARADLGRILEGCGMRGEAREAYQNALASLEDTDHRILIAQVLTYLGDLEEKSGRPAEAKELHGRGLAYRRLSGERTGLATSLRGLGRAHLALGDSVAAQEALTEALGIFLQYGDAGSAASVRMPLSVTQNRLGLKRQSRENQLQANLELDAFTDAEIMARYNDESLTRLKRVAS